MKVSQLNTDAYIAPLQLRQSKSRLGAKAYSQNSISPGKELLMSGAGFS